MSTIQVNKEAHRAKAQLFRTGHIVRELSGNVVCDGSVTVKNYPWCNNVSGINVAKKFVRKSGQVSVNN